MRKGMILAVLIMAGWFVYLPRISPANGLPSSIHRLAFRNMSLNLRLRARN